MKGEPVPVKERYTEYGKDWIKRYSDNGMMIERDGKTYSEAVDEAKYEFDRVYYETDIPVEAEATTETDLTVSDTLEMLSEMGVDVSD